MLPWHCLALSSLRSKQGPREKARKGQPCLDYNHCVCVSLMRRVGPGVNRRFARHCVANATLSIVRQTQCLGQPERLLTAQGPTSDLLNPLLLVEIKGIERKSGPPVSFSLPKDPLRENNTGLLAVHFSFNFHK